MRESVRPDSRPVYPPGTILQHLYLKERSANWAPGTFVEVGVGAGHVSNLLLSLGWSGTGYELNAEALARASTLNRVWIESGRFAVRNSDWLASGGQPESADLVVSSMVLEHLDEPQVAQYFEQAARQLRPGGRAVFFVPGSPRHWGVEDEIAGHYRRYTISSFSDAARQHGWSPVHVVGLTYPLSNLLLGVSNALVRRAEADKQTLSLQERTEQSGNRDVEWKTDFPGWTAMFLNETALRPAHWLQKRKRSQASDDALVIYAECSPPGRPLPRSE
jgi:SAM-dependent methyltransferase